MEKFWEQSIKTWVDRHQNRHFEFLTGLQSFGASLGSIYDQNYNGLIVGLSYQQIFMISSYIAIAQMFASFPFNNLVIRHYTNLATCVLSILISYIVYKNPEGDLLGIGGFLSLAIMSFYCSFTTKNIINSK